MQSHEDDATATRRALELELREARYEAERAQRQYDAVEPEHRLVAATLEQRWNAALERVATLEQRKTQLKRRSITSWGGEILISPR